ncbi:MAG: YihA family ribosome biogenesis GTP-binding protein [Alicyclobacillaceae bacterium]|nr:YihA family ribosome biogenesis GTP-binding protein [Alicyclobacillaceae bacterium]
MIVRSAAFELGAVRREQWPPGGLPEFAFVGRSNVGKSSLLNSLLGRRSLARVSATPGKTQQINFFLINGSFRFVDLPGYGYAAVSKRDRARFVRMMEAYLRERDALRRVLHLIDIRHPPTATDVEVHRFLQSLGLPLAVVATKADKVSRSEAQRSVQRIRSSLQTAWPVLSVSAEKNQGLEALWAVIEADLAAAGAGGSPS